MFKKAFCCRIGPVETILPKGPLCHLLNTGIASHCAVIYTGNVGSSDPGLTCTELTVYLIWLPLCFYQIFLSGEQALWRTMAFVGGTKKRFQTSIHVFTVIMAHGCVISSDWNKMSAIKKEHNSKNLFSCLQHSSAEVICVVWCRCEMDYYILELRHSVYFLHVNSSAPAWVRGMATGKQYWQGGCSSCAICFCMSMLGNYCSLG